MRPHLLALLLLLSPAATWAQHFPPLGLSDGPPHILTLQGKSWSVAEVEDLTNRCGTDCVGFTDQKTRMIFLKRGDKDERRTLIHEILHAEAMELKFGIEKQTFQRHNYHHFIYFVSPLLLEALQHNPALVWYLTDTASDDNEQ